MVSSQKQKSISQPNLQPHRGWFRNSLRLNPLPLTQLCRSSRAEQQQTLSAFDIPSCCVAALRCTLSATLRSSAARQTDSETSSPPNTLPATVRGSFRLAHSASAFPAECALTRSSVPRTTPENADSLAPGRCRSGSPAAARARPQSPPASTRVTLLLCTDSGYRRPYDSIFERAKTKEWSGRADFEPRTSCAQARCATSRKSFFFNLLRRSRCCNTIEYASVVNSIPFGVE